MMTVAPSIDLATNEELLEELFNRSTFAGALVYSPVNHRFQGQNHKNFRLLTTCEHDSAIHLIETALLTLKKNRTDAS